MTMKIRTLHLWFLCLAIPSLAGAGWMSLHCLQRDGNLQIHALWWASATSGLHAIQGWHLWKQHLQVEHSRIASGLKILGVHFFTGVGLFVTGIVMNPEAKEAFATMWTGFFLILFVSETIFFIKGVQEL